MVLEKQAQERRLKIIEQHLELCREFIPKGSKVLDIGCGDGLPAELMQKKLGAKVVCLDKNSKLFDKTKKLRFVAGDAEKLEFPDKSFDATVLFYVLHHCKRPEKVLQEAERVTKKRIIIIEEFYKSKINKALMVVYDFLMNKLLYPEGEFSVNFLKQEDFVKQAKELLLEIEKDHAFEKKWYHPPNKKLIVLKKKEKKEATENVETKTIGGKTAHVVVVALIDDGKRLVMLERSYPIKCTSLIIGHIAKGENELETLEREVLEETGGKILEKKFLGERVFDYGWKCTRGAHLHEWRIYKVKVDKVRKKEIDEGKLLQVPFKKISKQKGVTEMVKQTLKDFGYIK